MFNKDPSAHPKSMNVSESTKDKKYALSKSDFRILSLYTFKFAISIL